MKTLPNRARLEFLFIVVPLIVGPLIASCSFGLTPATLGRSSATVSIAFPPGTVPPTPSRSPQAGSGDSRAVAPGANWIYLRAGEGDGSFETYGPYEVGSGTFTTKDIPAGTYDYLAILLVSEAIPAQTELSVGKTTVTFSGALSLPDERFFALLSDGTLSAFFDSRFCVASGYIVKRCKITSGKNVISATLVPLTAREAYVFTEPPSASFSCPQNTSENLRQIYFRADALDYSGSVGTPSVKVVFGPSLAAEWSRIGSVILYSETGAQLGRLDVNDTVTYSEENPEASYRTFTAQNPSRGACYVYASYQNQMEIGLIPVEAEPVEEVGTYVSSAGKAGAAGTRADPQSLAYAVNKDESPTILLLDDVETNMTLSVTRTLTIKPVSGVTLPRIKAASGFSNSYFSVLSDGNLTLQNVRLEGLTEGNVSLLEIAGGSATLTGGTVITGSRGIPAPGGGAAYVSSGTLVLDGATIEQCSSSRGGGVYVASSGILVIKGSSAIRDCSALELGGGVYTENGGTVDISVSGASSITANSAQVGGGGVFLCENANFTQGSGGWASKVTGNNPDYALPNLARRVLVSDESSLEFALADTTFPRYIEPAIDFTVSYTIMTKGECALSSLSPSTISRATGFTDGPLFTVPSGTSLSIGGSLTIEGLGLSVDVIAPLVRVVGGNFAVRDSAMLIGNKNTVALVSSDYLGGAVNVNYGTFVMYGGSLGTNDDGANTSLRGGNVYVYGGTFIFRGGVIHYGSATDSSSMSGGGGVYVDGYINNASFQMPSGSTGMICTNGATSNGGGVFLYGPNAKAALAGGTIGSTYPGEGNTSNSANGGGVYLNGGAQATLSGTKIVNNTANGNGGGISVLSGSVLTIDEALITLTQPLVTNNTANNSFGGGLYIDSPLCCVASDSLKGKVFNGNMAFDNSTNEWNMP